MLVPVFVVAIAASVCAFSLQPANAQGRHTNLPEGNGKELVEAICTGCHQSNQITRSSGYSEDDWRALTGSMIDLSESPAERDAILRYLTAHFPPHDRRAPTLVPGDVDIAFQEWLTPTLGQRTRDPVEAPDGAIWWAGQWGNLVGRLDPASGAMTEIALPANAMPHSVTPDAKGDIWYTGNKNGTIGRVDAKTGAITEYKMPDPAARDPHTAEFDQAGTLWFTLQQSNMIGRLDPETGDIRLVTMNRSGARPYGIKIDAAGTPWVACNGSNCLVKVDPVSMALTEIDLPTPGTTVRRLDIAEDGTIWYVNSGAGKLGRYDPASGDIREWASPSGPKSHPYAIAVVDGIVWYNESGMRPDTLVRFDPATETFQSWAIPSGDFHAGIIRHMRPARNGDLLIHQSSTNRIIRVSVTGGSARTQ